jgi:hypothetical protein
VHKFECKKDEAPEIVRLARRILIAVSQHDTKNTLCNHYNMLCDNYEKQSQENLERFAPLAIQLTQTTPKKYLPNTSKDILRLFAKIKCNAMAIYDEMTLEQIGVGIYPLAATMNHDCMPNTILAFSKKGVTLRANCDIEAGTEVDTLYSPSLMILTELTHQLTTSYIDTLLSRAERVKYLKHHYFFDCKCKSCNADYSPPVEQIQLLDQQLLFHLDRQNMKEVMTIASDLERIYKEALPPGHIARIIKSVMICRSWAEIARLSEARSLCAQWSVTVNMVEAALGRIGLWKDLKVQERKIIEWMHSS